MSLTGNIDTLTRSHLIGWACDTERPDDVVSLIVSENGEILGKVQADRLRPDLSAAGYGHGCYGFLLEFRVPLSLATHDLEVRRDSNDDPLPGSPVRLEAATLFDAETQRVADWFLSHATDGELPNCIDFLTRQLERIRERRATLEPRRSEGDRTLMPRQRGRALVIDAQVPETHRDAGSDAILSHMRALRRLGFAVEFVSVTMGGPSAALEAEGIACHRRPLFASVEEVLQRQSDAFALVYMHRVDTVSRYMALARLHQPRARLLYSVADLHFLRYARQAAVEGRLELLEHSNYMRALEIGAAHQADVVVTHSSFEAQLLRRDFGVKNVHVIPWSVETRQTPAPFAERRGMAFVASYGHSPNADAARWLVEHVLPMVLVRLPDFRCLLVGSMMPSWLEALASPNLSVEGHIDDLDDLFSRVRLTIAPLAFGAGIKGKVLASLAAGVPCACTSTAAEGLDLPPRLQALVADEPTALATIVERLHEDEAFNHSCAEAGLDYARARLSDLAVGASLRLATREI